MTFETVIGQSEAKRVLEAVAPTHILLITTPGMGKTHMAIAYADMVVGDGAEYILVDGTVLAEKRLSDIHTQKGRIASEFPGPVIIDEVHVMKNFEQLYPLIDKRPLVTGPNWTRVFILTTTDEGKLPPALLSRLVVISLKQYNTSELADIAGTAADFPRDVRLEIARLCHGNPRRAKIIAGLLDEVGKKNNRAVQAGEVRGVMKYLGYPEGLYDRELEIMRALSDSTRSISTLCALLATSKETIAYWETGLIGAGLVTISPRGRALTTEGQQLLARVDGKVGDEQDTVKV
jgi:Holliday junction resolvasome RuvABC ATP-dependent DNA helicase subunit